MRTTETRQLLLCALLGLACVLTVGCSQESAEPEETNNVEVLEPLSTPASDATSPAEPAELIDPEPKSEKQAQYESPYPNRTNLFEPLRQANRVSLAKGNDGAESVVLMGFANIDVPKVVLAIDGIVTPMANGDEQAGVKVISISPPLAVLQRGRSRWTAKLE